MMKRKIAILCACAFLLTLYSCDSLMNNNGRGRGIATPNNPSMIQGRSNNSVLTITNGKRTDLITVYRFRTNIQAKGTFKPGDPIQLVVSVRATLPTKDVHVKLFLPAIHALKQSQPGQPATIPVGEPLKPQASWSRTLSQGGVMTRQKTITVKQPGYYHVILSVKAKNAHKVTKGGEPIKNQTTNNLWLWITDKGGKATQKFDRSLFPKDIRPQSGPLTKKTVSQSYNLSRHTEH